MRAAGRSTGKELCGWTAGSKTGGEQGPEELGLTPRAVGDPGGTPAEEGKGQV